MTSLQLTAVYEPARAGSAVDAVDPALFERFLAAVERQPDVVLDRAHGPLREVATNDGFILLAASVHPTILLGELPQEEQRRVASKLVPIGVDSSGVLDDLLEPLALPAAVDTQLLQHWETSSLMLLGAWGPYGRPEVGRTVGASCLRRGHHLRTSESAHYCCLHGPMHHGLPHLLVDYLRAYANKVGHS